VSEQQINETIPAFQRDGQSLLDVNGDGLVDRVVANGSTLAVRFNTGNGFFSGGESYNGMQSRDTVENKAASIGGGGYFTISIGPLCIAACYLIINPGGDVSESLNKAEVVLQDVNGDGYPDHLMSEEDGELRASLNNHGRTNLLKRVDRPMHGWFEVDYERKGNTFEDPNSHWALSRVLSYDGLAGDGTDYQLRTITYGPGFYDRFEREFYGFSEVVETNRDTTGIAPAVLAATPDAAPAYRKTKREYHNDSYFTKGMMSRETVIGLDTGSELVYGVNENDFLLREVDTGLETTDPTALRFTLSPVFPMLQSTSMKHSEGNPSIYLQTQTFMTYDVYGNTATLIDTGDAGSGDDYSATITYTGAAGGPHESCADNYIVGQADSIVVRNAAGAILRQRNADYDCPGGDLVGLTHVTDAAGSTSSSAFAYDSFGNLSQVVGAPNHAGERYTLNFTYDPDIQTHIASATDSFGYSSETQYDLRFGEPSSITDQNGNTITKTFDAFGRPATVVGPYEQTTGYATVTYEYHPEATVPWARTQNLDPFRDLADPIETIVFTDGMKRVVQSKKDITEHQGAGGAAVDRMSVSGLQTSDFVGRLVDKYYPTVEPKNNTANEQYNPMPDGVTPTRNSYDVMDRLTHTDYPDGTTMSQVYSLDNDRHGVRRAVLTVTDQMGNDSVTYSDVREQVMATQQFNTNKGEVIWTEYAYTPMQEAVGITDDHGNVTTIEYDLMGRRTAIDSPDNGRTEMTYDPADNMITKVTGKLRAAGAEVTYQYEFNRLIAINYPLFPENNVAYTYGDATLRGHGGNKVGRITHESDESGTEDREYGKLGEVVKVTKTLASDTMGACDHCQEEWTTRWVYDTFGRLQQMTYPDTEVVTYHYDSGGLVRAVDGQKLGEDYQYIDRLEYDKFEMRAFMEYGNGVRTSYTFDPESRRLTNLNAGNFQKLVYEYDDIGNITRLQNDVSMGHPNELGGPVDKTFEYDSLYRLTSSTGSWRYAPQKTDAYELTLEYDTINNILSKDQNHTRQTKTNNPIRQHKTTYDWTYEYSSAQPHAPSRIAGEAAPGMADRAFFYDESGNQTGWDDLTSGRRRTIVWDEEDRIQEIADNGRTTRYKYDDGGQRVIKRGAQGETAYINQFWTARNRSIGTKHIFVGESRMVSKLSPGNTSANPGSSDPFGLMMKNWYDHHVGTFPGRMRGRLPDNNFLYWYHADHLGSTGWVTNPDGDLYEHIEYFPFGETWVAEDSNTERMPYLFTSKELDQETDLYYYGARYYDPKTSVWQSSDPQIVDKPGTIIGNPMVLAGYTYTALNPLRIIDPDGRENKSSWLGRAASWITTTDLGVIEFIPYVGTAIDVARVAAYTYQGDYVNAGITAATVAVGLIPGGGAAAKGAAKAGKALLKEGAKEAAHVVAKKAVKEAVEEGAEQAVKKVAKEAPVIVGETMARVDKYAAKHGGETITDWMKKNGISKWDEAVNDKFIAEMKKQGRKFEDIGPDFNKRLKGKIDPTDMVNGRKPSKVYGKEREQLKNYTDYERKYERTGKYEGGVPGFDK
jgi:RHS repeat-associated protein